MFDTGVKEYVRAYAVVEVAFPVSWKGKREVACKHCQFYVRVTQRCALNQQVVNYPEEYVGAACPLQIVEEEKEENV
jgi:hypothetical protein